ncbi:MULTISPECIES: MFS transporter [unclassified Brevundimonas]|jgi:PPP family 3-phenylpropionic acid transporter|uniref:MFS transporter n=1 Tax=unclassified Brevundimonas TaxID=2622653 RepID=UPI000C418DC9|nr:MULTISPECIES: MFS transporter [unclassified Brevundimonas]MAL88057.1 MFS transporter [Brevundimonas sp.]HAJ03539.1 MFS transporter [Brevundimonas sp.]|tara:strand:+ start:16710 stop:17891 length:1182 start_codon:yes stop_codon:yes gene_type:complete
MTPPFRLALHYVLLFGVTGVSLPFAGLWLKSLGLDGAEIGTLLAVPMLARFLTGPMIAVWADGFATRRAPIAILGWVAVAGYGAAALVEGYVLWTACWFVAATATSAIIPLIDVLSLRVARREGFSFSVPRGFGSAAFVLANLAMGALLIQLPVAAVIVWIVAGSALMALYAQFGLPAEVVSAAGRASGRNRFLGLGRLLADPVFMMALLAIGAVQASHGFYYGFSAILWTQQGLSTGLVGALWAGSVIIEIGFMWWLDPWRRRLGIGPWPMLAVGVGAGVLRWTALAFSPPLALLWPFQALHALTFAATYLAGVEIVERLAPEDAQTAAQTLSSTVSAGVLIGIATVLSGPLYDSYGAGGYLAMAGMAALGGLAALSLRRRLGSGRAGAGQG